MTDVLWAALCGALAAAAALLIGKVVLLRRSAAEIQIGRASCRERVCRYV